MKKVSHLFLWLRALNNWFGIDTRPLPKTHFSALAPSSLMSRPALLPPPPVPAPSRISLGGPSHHTLAVPAPLNAFGFNVNGNSRNSLGGGEKTAELGTKVRQSEMDLDEKVRVWYSVKI